MKTIVFAGGCFWGVEAYFKQVEGVIGTRVGYIDGPFRNPGYEAVCAGSGHAEAVKVEYDPAVVGLEKLLEHYFNIVDPTTINRQGPDIGVQYRSGIYNYEDKDESVITAVMGDVATRHDRPLRISLRRGLPFDEAEEAHQDYLDKNENGYCHIDLNRVKDIT